MARESDETVECERTPSAGSGLPDQGASLSVTGAIDRARTESTLGRRVLIGITGPPGSGKSTLASEIRDALGARAVVVPMDGFHLAQAQLERLGLARQKGAPETFDASGYVSLLRRLREPTADTVYAPAFDRTIEEPIAGAIAVEPGVELVVTEGNYLLLDSSPWCAIPKLVDEVWYCDVPNDVRRARLVARHEQFGKGTVDASSWVEDVDEPNARLVSATRPRANWFVRHR